MCALLCKDNKASLRKRLLTLTASVWFHRNVSSSVLGGLSVTKYYHICLIIMARFIWFKDHLLKV